MNGGRVFFDTNVLLNALVRALLQEKVTGEARAGSSSADIWKQTRARDLYREYAFTSRILLSTQVVQEFFVAGLRKLKLPRREVQEVTAAFLDSPLIIVDPSHIRAAIEKEDRYNISFWDALIVAAAQSGGAELLYTEELNDGQQYDGVLARNPFRQMDIP